MTEHARMAGLRRRPPSSVLDWVRVDAANGPLPRVLSPGFAGVNLAEWLTQCRGHVAAELLRHGALLFRGFAVPDVDAFERVASALATQLCEYELRSSPRSRVGSQSYTSTEYPAERSIFLHNENSYAHRWPARLLFYCQVAPEVGGETPLADVRRVCARLDPGVKQQFARRKIRYVRRFGYGAGLRLDEVFQTSARADVERQCAEAGYDIAWGEGGRLQIARVGEARALHPATREEVWFNHAVFFHVSTLAQELGIDATRLDESTLPNTTHYGDGGAIEPDVIEIIRAAYLAELRAFRWQTQDVLWVDNMLVAHGRASFRGERRIVVALDDSVLDTSCRLGDG